MADETIRYVHLLAASIWIGGLIVLGSIAVALRRAGAERDLLRAMARGYGRIAWPAMVVAVAAGFWQAARLDVDWGRTAMLVKMLLVFLVVGLAAIHQLTARTTSPALRGVLQGLILLGSLGILGAAVAL